MNGSKPCKTIEEALNTAVGYEEAVAVIYAELAEKFASEPEQAELWASMREDELVHAQVLRTVHEKISPKKRSELVPDNICESLDNLQELFDSANIKNIQTFDDAYNVAHAFEFSEINAVFKFMATQVVPDNQHPAFLDNQVDEHLYKLLDFKHKYSSRK
jgi:rubrerythrin